MVKVTDQVQASTALPVIICDYSPPRSGLLSDISPPPTGADFLLVNANPGRSVRADSAILAAVLKQQTGKEVIFALLTRDMNRLALQSHLLGAQLLGLENVVVAGGDRFHQNEPSAVSTVSDFRPTELIASVTGMNQGRDFRGRNLASPTNFCVGATVDLARDSATECKLAARKVASGAEFFITQPLFSVHSKERFEGTYFKTTGDGCPVPIFWGLQLLEKGSVSFAPVPARFQNELESGRSGVDIALEVFHQLHGSGVSHVYLLPPIRPGGQRNYEVAQEFIEAIGK